MLFQRIFVSTLIALARNPNVQKKAATVAEKTLNLTRPTLLNVSRNTGAFVRKTSQKIRKINFHL